MPPRAAWRCGWPTACPCRRRWPCGPAWRPLPGMSYPPWLGFRGGKGMATTAGVFAVLAPAATLVSALVFVVIARRDAGRVGGVDGRDDGAATAHGVVRRLAAGRHGGVRRCGLRGVPASYEHAATLARNRATAGAGPVTAAVVGAGSWGTALAHAPGACRHTVHLCARDARARGARARDARERRVPARRRVARRRRADARDRRRGGPGIDDCVGRAVSRHAHHPAFDRRRGPPRHGGCQRHEGPGARDVEAHVRSAGRGAAGDMSSRRALGPELRARGRA